MNESHFPPGTRVRVQQMIDHRSDPIGAQVTGVVEAWEELPTGSWHAHGKDGKLWLMMLNLDMLINSELLPPELTEIAIRVNQAMLDVMVAGATGEF